jgi:hypothetical protein
VKAPDLFAPAPEKAPAVTPCTRPWNGWHSCYVGGGDASFSDDFGRSRWFCRAHAPANFFPRVIPGGNR